ncbi:hypothetical protein CR51_14385 [Caballeronia megalochromosomata]|nr:hypothetical protein CR51_14385 [Caballeronia megalochromosomata]
MTAGALVVIAGVVWFIGWQLDWSADRIAGIGFGLLAVLLTVVVSRLVVDRWILRARWVGTQGDSHAWENDRSRKRSRFVPSVAARELMRSLEGVRHWRYRTRWLLIVGERALVERVVPGLTTTCYVVRGDTVVLYANQSDGEPDHDWLTQIRCLRRRRPIDAVVAITSDARGQRESVDADMLAQRLARNARSLGWAAPVYVVDVAECHGTAWDPDRGIGLSWPNRPMPTAELNASLLDLTGTLADEGVFRLAQDPRDRVLAELSQHIDGARERLCGLMTRIVESGVWRNDVHGLFFAPAFPGTAISQSMAVRGVQMRYPALWQTIAAHSRKVYGRRVGFSWSTTAACATIAAAAIWLLGSVISGVSNRSSMQDVASTVNTASSTHDATQALLALDALDKQLDTLEAVSYTHLTLTTRELR